jgi:RimJ/RimL family protein N-acetyltransferase
MIPVTTQRLTLHPVSMADLDDFIALHAADAEPRPDDTLTRLPEEFCATWESGGHGYWKIVFDGRTAGFGGVKPKTWRCRNVWNLYYRIRPELRGRGLATEMARKAVSVAAGLRPGWPVLVETRPANAAAIKVAEGLGMTRHPDADGWAVFLLEN